MYSFLQAKTRLMHFNFWDNPFNDNSDFTGSKVLDILLTGGFLMAGEVFSTLHFASHIADTISWCAKNFSYTCCGLAALCTVFPPLKDVLLGWAMAGINFVKRIF